MDIRHVLAIIINPWLEHGTRRGDASAASQRTSKQTPSRSSASTQLRTDRSLHIDAIALAGPSHADSSKIVDGSGTSKEELGRATWTFLHTLAAQYPQTPTRRQRKDTAALIDSMSRMYPCAECAGHFAAAVRADPPRVECREDLEQWMCQLHNRVNRRLGKAEFNCSMVHARWAGVDCDVPSACDLTLPGAHRH